MTLRRLDSGAEEFGTCDTLITALGLIPKRELTRGLGSPDWLFFAGNCRRVHDLVDSAAAEAEQIGRSASKNILTNFYECVTLRIESFECEVACMEQVYIDTAKMLRAMSDPKRLRIVDMLSCGELCACKILEEFHITQPTLSHDMKVLSEAGIVRQKREGKNIYYSLNEEALAAMHQTLGRIIEDKPDCICHIKSNKD